MTCPYLKRIPIWKWSVLFIVSLIITYLIGEILLGVLESLPHKWNVYLLYVVGVSSVYLILTSFFIGNIEERTISELDIKKMVPDFLKGVCIGIVYIIIVLFILYVLGCLKISTVHIDLNNIACVSLMLLLAAISEELIFRGVILRMIQTRWGTIIAFVASSFLFGLSHYINPNSSLWSCIAIALMAVESALFVFSRRLWMPIGMHFSWNFAQGVIFGIPVSGLDLGVSFFSSELNGISLLTGGPFGIETSIISVIVGVCITVYYLKKSYQWFNFTKLRGHIS